MPDTAQMLKEQTMQNLDEWRATNQGEFHHFQLNIFPILGYTNTPIHSTTTG